MIAAFRTGRGLHSATQSPHMRTPPAHEGEPGAFSLQLDCLDLGHERAAIVGREYCCNAEDGANEAADVQDVA